MYKLREAGINSYILKIIDHYLRNRNVYIEIGENRSESFKPEIALPQRSILSPILFIFYIAEMFQECKGKTEKDCEEITKWMGKWRLKISGPKTEVVIFSSILEKIRVPTKNIVLQGNIIKFATESTALGITMDNKLKFGAQFEKCSRKTENAMGVLEPLVQNQFITPSTILKLMNCVVIPVWTHLSRIRANPTEFRTSSLWYKRLSKSSNTKYKHELTKMEYICSQFPIDLEIQLSQAKFAHQNGFDSDQCSRALSDSDSKVSRSLQSSLRGFARFSGIAPGEKYSKRICEHYRIELWNRRSRNILPEFPRIESTEPLIPRSFSKHATKLIIEMLTHQCYLRDFQYQLSRTSSPLCICNHEETSTHFIFYCSFYNNLRREHIKFGSFEELIRKRSHSDMINLLDLIKKSSRFCNL